MTVFYRRDIRALYEKYHVMEKFGRLMAEEAYLMLDRGMSHFQFHDLKTRYLAMLQEEPGLLQRIPQHLLAIYLGVTPESLSRIKQAVARQKNKPASLLVLHQCTPAGAAVPLCLSNK